jgi:hypothetical protein
MQRDAPQRELIIDKVWSGEPAEAYEVAHIRLRRHGGGLELQVEAPWHGDPAPPATAGPTDRLWEFEVVELFVAGSGSPPLRYTEVELSPFGHHLVLRFLGVRNAVDRALQLRYDAQLSDGRWTGTAMIPARYLPPEPWTANAFAIHGAGAQRRFLVAHPMKSDQPDFHRPQEFPTLDLA